MILRQLRGLIGPADAENTPSLPYKISVGTAPKAIRSLGLLEEWPFTLLQRLTLQRTLAHPTRHHTLANAPLTRIQPLSAPFLALSVVSPHLTTTRPL
jgi:hypothetical protein